jgi:hypothetical protein
MVFWASKPNKFSKQNSKNSPPKRSYQHMNIASHDFFWGGLYSKVISTIHKTWMAMKPYINRMGVEYM